MSACMDMACSKRRADGSSWCKKHRENFGVECPKIGRVFYLEDELLGPLMTTGDECVAVKVEL